MDRQIGNLIIPPSRYHKTIPKKANIASCTYLFPLSFFGRPASHLGWSSILLLSLAWILIPFLALLLLVNGLQIRDIELSSLAFGSFRLESRVGFEIPFLFDLKHLLTTLLAGIAPPNGAYTVRDTTTKTFPEMGQVRSQVRVTLISEFSRDCAARCGSQHSSLKFQLLTNLTFTFHHTFTFLLLYTHHSVGQDRMRPLLLSRRRNRDSFLTRHSTYINSPT